MIRVALAGFSQGYYATTYLRYLARLREIEILAVCDCGAPADYVQECAFTTAEAFAGELGVPLLHEYERLLKLRPDALLLCCETHDHARLAKAALARGIHTFVSKPLSFSSEDTALLRPAAQKGACLLCGNPLKYEPGLEELQRRLAGGEIGRVYSLRLTVNHLAMTAQAWERDAARSGGPLGTYGVYLFDLARWLTGQPLHRLYALAANCATPEITCPDTVKILGEGKGGIQFNLELYSAIRHEYPFVQAEAVGDKGTLVTRYDNYATLAQTQRGAALGALRSGEMGTAEMEHFLACVRGEAAPRCSLADMDYVARCIEAAGQSIRTRLPAAVQPQKTGYKE